jgi:YaiO family outer membrane protein
VGNYWLSARPFITPKDDGTSVTAILSARRYYADADHYVGVSAGYGSAPSDLITEAELEREHSWKAAFEGKASIHGPLRLTCRLSYNREEQALRDPLNRWGMKVGFERDFF